MARDDKESGRRGGQRAEAGSLPSPVAQEAAQAATVPKPITVAFALESRMVNLTGGLTRVLGGEFISDPGDVAIVKADPAFKLIAFASRQEFAQAQQAYLKEVAAVRAQAKALGLVVYREGEIDQGKGRRR